VRVANLADDRAHDARCKEAHVPDLALPSQFRL